MTPEQIREWAESAWQDAYICNGRIKALESAARELLAMQKEEIAKIATRAAEVGVGDHRIRPKHAAADAFWEYWKANGETHKHGYYESTWGAINAALKVAGLDSAALRAAPSLSKEEWGMLNEMLNTYEIGGPRERDWKWYDLRAKVRELEGKSHG